MSEYPWNVKDNTFTWLHSLYNPFKTNLLFLIIMEDITFMADIKASSN